ncbi:MAG: hypothetical protein EKK46_12505 [Rhodocyclaceae bacterium]|nr:MAG: hypothetical protein EKK46_12505 [Rhodocyclaceae bacterium]
MTLTDIAAWYAAAVATAVFVWDVIKWFRNGPRLRVNTACGVGYPDGRVISKHKTEDGAEVTTLADYCHIEVLNIGGQPTTLIDIQVTNVKRKNGMKIGFSGPAFTIHAGSHSLPTLLGPGEMWSARVEMTQVESIAKHGHPILQIRTSHSAKVIKAAIGIKR